MSSVAQAVPKAPSEREQLRRRLLELILKREAKRRQASGKRAGE
jgi:hypothetical protein